MKLFVDEKRKKSKGLQIHKRKLFKRNQDMIFEQDFAQPHCTNVNQTFMEENFAAHTSTLWRYQDEHELFFRAKWDDFWSIERLWGIYSQEVYRNPRPTHIDGVMRRLREAVRSTDPKTLTKLIHELPAKMHEIYRLKGKKNPSSFDPRKSPFAAIAMCALLEYFKFYYVLNDKFEHSTFKDSSKVSEMFPFFNF